MRGKQELSNIIPYIYVSHLFMVCTDPLESYPNLAKFFTRHLKDGVRPIAKEEIVSPADSRISVFGELKDGDRLEQIKVPSSHTPAPSYVSIDHSYDCHDRV